MDFVVVISRLGMNGDYDSDGMDIFDDSDDATASKVTRLVSSIRPQRKRTKSFKQRVIDIESDDEEEATQLKVKKNSLKNEVKVWRSDSSLDSHSTPAAGSSSERENETALGLKRPRSDDTSLSSKKYVSSNIKRPRTDKCGITRAAVKDEAARKLAALKEELIGKMRRTPHLNSIHCTFDNFKTCISCLSKTFLLFVPRVALTSLQHRR